MKIISLVKIVEHRDLTPTYLEMLNSTYPTPKGGLLRVKYFIHTKHTYLKAILECSICSKDKDLWKEGTIMSSKGHLERGKSPCGCSKISKLSEWNTKILIKRLLAKQERDFLGWNGGWKGFSNTRVRFYDKKHDACFQDTKVSYLLHYPEKSWVKYPAYESKFKDYTDKVLRIKNYHSNYLNYTISPLSWYYDNRGGKLKFKWQCNNCHYSGYAPENTFRNKEKICACFNGKKCSSEEERFSRCISVCNSNGLTLISSKHNLKRSTSPVIWQCKKGHTNIWSFNNFSRKDVGCRYCVGHTNYNGFYTDKIKEEDTLYFLRFKSPEGEDFYKIGRTFRINNRLAALSKGYEITPVILFTGNHLDIYTAEQDTLCRFSDFKYIPKGKGKRTREYLNSSIDEMAVIYYLTNRSGIKVK